MSNINVVFSKAGKTVMMQTNSKMMFAELALKYSQKVGIDLKADQIKFIFNSMEIKTDSCRELEEIGINNMARIDVVVGKDVIGAVKF